MQITTPLFSVVISSLLFVSIACNSQSAPQGASAPRAQRPISASAAPSMTAAAPTTARSAESYPLSADPAVIASAKKAITYLASDELEGRGVATKGLDLAAEYVANRFASLGLRTLPGQPDYFQRFDFTTSITVSDQTTLALNGASRTRREHFNAVTNTGEGKFDAPVVFVGYGISQPEEYKYDDYAGIDVKGKVVLAMRYEPRDERGRSRFSGEEAWSSAASITSKASEAEKRGAVALLLVSPPNELGGTTAPAATPASTPATTPTNPPTTAPATSPSDEERDSDRLMPFSRNAMGGRAGIPVIHIKRSEADALLAAAEAESLAQLQARIDLANAPASSTLANAKVSGNVVLQRHVAEVKNVMAMLPGHGPRADEYVIVGAHYDHVGRGGRSSMVPGSRAIHHGADDNASGTSALIELASNLVHAGRLDRSIIFIAFTAEEEGLIGSQHFVDHPPVSLSKVTSMLNMDMVGRIRDYSLYVGGSGTAPSFEPMLRAGDEASPLILKQSGMAVGKGGMGPSDHQSFALKKIPVLFFFSGDHPDYHRPTDTADKINYEGVGQSVALAQYFVNNLSRVPRQEYVDRFDKESTREHRGPSLGVIPDYSSAESTSGVRINGTRPESPAARAGLKTGDVITQLGGHTVRSIYDLTDALNKLQPGQRAKVVIKRGDHEVELEALMGGPRSGGG